eukprot:324629_1
MATKKRGNGTSCHHCKKRTQPNKMLRCTKTDVYVSNSKKRTRSCIKKYCINCISKWYSCTYLDKNKLGKFICPSCCDQCRCAYCRRGRVIKKTKTDGVSFKKSIHDEATGRELQISDRHIIEQQQVDAMLELLHGKVDIHDIIRSGMGISFDDPNAKILYIAHLIDQALNNPHILKLHSISNKRHTKNEQ